MRRRRVTTRYILTLEERRLSRRIQDTRKRLGTTRDPAPYLARLALLEREMSERLAARGYSWEKMRAAARAVALSREAKRAEVSS